ncbi:MAG: LacI family DNA-binding transcriptional regulator [Melioribacter sp.]|uniref:LacI family DNA-binding transcriptional regulator n=1 Tax=Rosettibacter primus TaxID=3111523 RepID=UPI00247BFAE7|nr:LacI family DNA-binding transcriptional regulator [Melioribacter sp.]
MRHSTLNDIARKLGISASTVSRALNDHPDISIETKKKVKKVAKDLDYKPNPIAQSLKSNRTTTIGVIVPEIKHDFFSSAISGIEQVAYNSGYTIILCQSNESFEREVVNTNLLMHHRVAGLIVSISQNTKQGNHFQDLIEKGIPLVFFDRTCEDVDTYKVVIDDKQSAFNAVSYLIQKGYKRIAHFAGPVGLDICKKRMNGYIEALNKHGLIINNELIIYGGLHEQDGYDSMSALLEKNIIPDAIFAVNDPVAIGAFQKIKEAGLRIPTDVAIVGFSNNKITSLVDPPLTTVNQPSFEMGKKAAEILINLIEKKNITEDKEIVLNADLIIRGSA